MSMFPFTSVFSSMHTRIHAWHTNAWHLHTYDAMLRIFFSKTQNTRLGAIVASNKSLEQAVNILLSFIHCSYILNVSRTNIPIDFNALYSHSSETSFFTLFIQHTVKVFRFKKKATFKNKLANPSIALRFLLAF